MKIKQRSIQSKTPRASLLIKLTIILCACSTSVLAQWTQPNTTGDINSTNTGNVGVGTTTPRAKLTVSNNTDSAPAGQPGTTAQIVGANGTTTRLVVDSFGTGGVSSSSIDMRRANNTALNPSALLNGNLIGQITWQGYGATSYNSASRARIAVNAAENYTDTAQGAFMTFSVAPRGGITMVEAMRIDATGFVGLGVSPAAKLDVLGVNAPAFRAIRDNAATGAFGATGVLYNPNTTANNYIGLAFQTLDTVGNPRTSSFIKAVTTARSAVGVTGDLAFIVSNDASIVEAVRVTSGSRVGIGTSAPNFKLDLQGGQINSSGGLCIAGDCKTAWSQVGGSQWTTSGTTINYSGGNVGIGTGSVAPVEKLEVVGNIKVSGNINAKYQDVAEWVESSQELPPGTVVVLDTSKSNQVIASTESYDSRIAGVISLQPGLTLGEQAEGRVLVATTGRVKVKVDATYGPIQIGDLLVTSSREGFAMKSTPVDVGGVRMHRPGTLIGKALEPLAKGTGEILVLLSLQ